MDYDLKLQHKAGSKMIVTGALSRHTDRLKGIDQDNVDVVALPDALWIKLVDTELQEAVADAQKNDKLAQEALRSLTDPLVSPSRWTIVSSGPDSSTRLMFYNGRLYIPDNLGLRHQIVSNHHDIPMAGHLSALAMSRSIRTSYWWPGLSSFVSKYVQGCAICQQFKVRTQPQRPSLVPIPSLSEHIFGQVGIDFMTDLPPSDGFDSIMVVVDHGLSKGVILTPCSKTGLIAEETSRLYINNVYSRFRLPDKMISDCGPQFDSQFWQELCTALQICHAMSMAFHPQTNGGTEQVIREIQTYLSIFCINNLNSWTQALKKAEFIYNNRPHTDRSQSPFKLWYGLAPKAIPKAFDYRDYPKTEE